MLDLKSSGTTAAELPRTTAFTNLSMLFAGTSADRSQFISVELAPRFFPPFARDAVEGFRSYYSIAYIISLSLSLFFLK